MRSALNAQDYTAVDWTALDFGFTLVKSKWDMSTASYPKLRRPIIVIIRKRAWGQATTEEKEKSQIIMTSQKNKRLAINSQEIPCTQIKPNRKWDVSCRKGKVLLGVQKFNSTSSECCNKFHTTSGACNKAKSSPHTKSHAKNLD
jgi:hypothetical protein